MFTQKFAFVVLLCLFSISVSHCKSYKIKNNESSVVAVDNKNVSTSGVDTVDRINRMGRFLNSNFLSNAQQLLMNLTMDLNGLSNLANPAGNISCITQQAAMLEALKIPLYIILPAIIIGVVILIVKIGLGVAWIPSKTAGYFQSLQSSGYGDSGGYGNGWSSDSPSSGYGYASAPSPAYGAPSLSRQTNILESIDDMNNQYGQQSGSSNLASYPYSSDSGQAQNDMYYYSPPPGGSQMTNNNSPPVKG